MSENLRKLIGLAVMAAIVVIGLVVRGGDDTDFTRNRSFRDNPATFAGADRLQEADCCDENAYKISKLENEVGHLQASMSTLTATSNILKQMYQDDYDTARDFAWELHMTECPYSSYGLNVSNYPAEQTFIRGEKCIDKGLIGLELEFARLVIAIMADPGPNQYWLPYGFFERWTKPNLASEKVLSEEACMPINYGGFPPGKSPKAIAVDTVNGIVADVVHFGLTHNMYHKGEWEDKIEEQGLCG